MIEIFTTRQSHKGEYYTNNQFGSMNNCMMIIEVDETTDSDQNVSRSYSDYLTSFLDLQYDKMESENNTQISI